ncbi:MAG: 50S ribosomal protein L13 [Candidatus Tectomicrobia bacterium]|nr:50S ribosomal protein L13 [Candidatus Tectomicrobia bacterium]
MKTFVAKKEEIEPSWYIIDAKGKILGRLATRVAMILRGKHKPTFTPHVDAGDHVIVINAAAVRLTGKKLEQKLYRHHSGYHGGLKEESAQKVLQRKPEFIIEEAVRGMLPKNSLGRQLFRKLRVYAGTTHPHAAQQPKPLEQ